MRTRLVSAALVALLSVGALAGCTASGGAAGSSGGGSSTEYQSAEGSVPAAASAADTAGKAAVPADRQVVTTASLRLVSAHPIRAAQRITALVEAAAGTVSQAREDPSGRASADLTLRIPAAEFDATLAAIRKGEDVRDLTINSTDVTAKVTDYGVRIANLRTSIARLQQLLGTATSSSALVEIEGALTDRQGSLEQLLAQQRTLADQVTYATLTVDVVVPAAAPSTGPTNFLAGFVTGFAALTQFAAGVTVVAGVLLPWVVVLAVLGGLGWVVARRVRRRPASA